MYKNIFYMSVLSKIGGTESFFYYMARKYKDNDITFFYRTGDAEQVKRLKKYARVIKWNGEVIECKKAFFNYFTDIINYVKADEYIQVLHTDYKEQMKNIGYGIKPDHRITKFIGVSKVVCKHFTELTGIPCELCYNPIELDKPKKVLNLVSATRLTKEKGKERMIKLGKLLDEANIPYLWTVFTNDYKEIDNENIIYMKPRLDISDYIANADYLVQLSSNGEGFGYTPAEALTLGTPVIVTPCDAFKEIGIKDGVNGFMLDFNMENVDVNRIYKSKLEVDWKPPRSNWCNLLEKGKSTYKEEMKMVHRVRATKEYKVECLTDAVLGFVPEEGYEFEVDEERFRILSGNNSYNKVFVTEVIQPLKKPEELKEAEENKPEEKKPEEDKKKVVPKKETAVKKVPNKKKAVK